jgi:hypothetical protein
MFHSGNAVVLKTTQTQVEIDCPGAVIQNSNFAGNLSEQIRLKSKGRERQIRWNAGYLPPGSEWEVLVNPSRMQ